MTSQEIYWKIKCTKHLSTLFETKINVRNISEKKLIEFIKTLVYKYALSDGEILEQYLQAPFNAKRNYIDIKRISNNLNEPLNISYITQVADISVHACMTN